MKLSEAIMLGSVMGSNITNVSWDTCLIGIGINALGKTNHNNTEALDRFPWLLRRLVPPPFAEMGHGPYLATIICTALASRITEKKITVEQVVDWVASVEPAETPIEEALDCPTDVSLTKVGEL